MPRLLSTAFAAGLVAGLNLAIAQPPATPQETPAPHARRVRKRRPAIRILPDT